MNTQCLLGHAIVVSMICAARVVAVPPVVDRGLLPGDGPLGPAVNAQNDVSIARGGDVSLVVWTDFRARSSGSQAIQSDGDIYGIRIDANGQPLDTVPFVIAGGFGLQQHPKVAWNGDNWLVIYESQDPTPGYFDTFIRAIRVSPSGQMLDTTPLTLPNGAFSPSNIGLNLAGQGGQWLVIRCLYHNDGYGTYLAGQRISGNGQLLDPTPVMLQDWIYGPTEIFANNGEYMVIGPDWNDSSTLKGRRIGTNLQPLAGVFSLPANVRAIAGNGNNEYYVAWVPDFVNIKGSRMTSSGTLLDPQGVTLIDNASWGISLAHDGTNWWALRSDPDTLHAMRINSAGVALDPMGGISHTLPAGTMTNQQAISRSGGGVLFTYAGSLGGDGNAYILPISQDNIPGSGRAVSTSTPNQRNSDLANGPDGTTAVAFVSEHGHSARVLVHMLDGAGNAMSAEPIEVAQDASIDSCGIAWNGSAYLVTWSAGNSNTSASTIFARRMLPDGTFLDAPFEVMPGGAACVEALGQNFCVAGNRYTTTFPLRVYLWAKRIDGVTGQILDQPDGLFLGGNFVLGRTRIRSDGSQWLVCSHSNYSLFSSQGDAVLARVPAQGAPTQIVNPTPYAGSTGDLDVAFSGNSYLLVWRSNTLGSPANSIEGRIMNVDGTFVGGAFVIASDQGRQLRPTVVWDGSAYIVAWDDTRDQAAFYDARTKVYAVRVGENGSILDPAPFRIVSGNLNHECSPALLSTSGRIFTTTSRFITSEGFSSYRVGLSIIGDLSCDSIDYNNDGLYPDTQDVDDFLSVFAGGSCSTGNCNDLDFNNDGLFPDTADLDALLHVFAGGQCS